MLNKFFVYGTLMTDCVNHKVIESEFIKKIEPAIIFDMELYIHPCGAFPCIIDGKGTVKGELITIKNIPLAYVTRMMDILEGYSEPNNPENLYERVVRLVETESGNVEFAYIYLYNNLNKLGDRIIDGNFKNYIKQKIGEENEQGTKDSK
jgi:gamma-glutamylcyclotransferase (GGCT)/AIG2-like uncharacterized protein YtfP